MTFVATDKGVPQGGIISPLLSNLVLHELDEYVGNLIQARTQANQNVKPLKANPKYDKIGRELRKCTDREERRRLITEKLKTPRHVPNPNHRKMKYVRYADDWLIGI